MKLEVNLSKKYFFILLGAILVLAGAIYGFAYGGSEPEVMGHSGGEIEVTINGETKLLNEALENLANSSLAFPYNCSPHDLGGTGGPTGNEHCKSLGGFCGGMWLWSDFEWFPRGCDNSRGQADCCIPENSA